MELKLVQKTVLETWENDVLISSTIVGNDLPLGKLHDSCMLLKGWTVDRMMMAQKQEEENAALFKAAQSQQEAQVEAVESLPLESDSACCGEE